MSQSVITKAFVEWKAKQAIDNKPVILDEFIFAHVPGLDINKPIANTEGIPDAGKIVHRQAVGKAGVVNLNAVVYSVTMGADVGDFDFNWIGLVNKASNTLAAIIHAPTQRKVKNASGQQGNVLTRSVLMEYNGAQTGTQINVPAETWQIDFTARLAGMDEAVRLASLDIYGQGAFFDNGFLVAKTANQYFVNQGLGYIGGLRAMLAVNQNITLAAKPTKVWADVSYHGTVTSAHRTEIKITVAASLADYVENGIAHYVFALASIDAAGVITDLRPKGSLGEQQGNSDFLRKDDNLAALKDKTKSRENLGLGSAAIRNTGIGSGEIALNGSFGIGGVTPEVAKDNTLSVIKGMGSGNYAVNAPSPDMPSTAVSYQLDWSLTSASGNRYGVLIARALSDKGQVNDKHWRNSLRNGVWQGWVMFYDSENKPTAADVNAYAKSESDSRYAYKSITINGKPLSSNVNLAAGDVNAWNKTESDGRFIYKTGDTINWLNVNSNLNIGLDASVNRALYVNGMDFIIKRGLQDPVNNERQTNGMRIQGAGNLLVDIYHHERIGQYHHFGIHLAGGGADGWYEFRGDGSFSAGATVGAGGANGAKLYQDGNLSGSQWGGYLSNWLSNNTISRVMRGSQGTMVMDGALVEAPTGCVLTGGNGNEGNQIGLALYRPLQIWRSGGWVTIEG
ncbi:phage tail protein [Serratia sp. JSRIV002]|uniref:phage tail-collar fiber domain-containing protein n=1 Tax=Serratia sp. JSRIV002 TaxID=2831894 RepID=UPI001CC08275|nr:phage tail protein [Serratia sp. JSRIV002]UAN50079.1 phage tail protein [Serratia sp. JSRIV002]